MTAAALTFTESLICGVPVCHVRYGTVLVGRINMSGYLCWSFQPILTDVDGYTAEQLQEIADWIEKKVNHA